MRERLQASDDIVDQLQYQLATGQQHCPFCGARFGTHRPMCDMAEWLCQRGRAR
jgi:hypothetical protein